MANAFAATFRDQEGRVVGYTSGSTVCWYPRKPSKLAAVSDDGRRETIIRCGFCLGCRELDRRRLADRLVKHYREEKQPIWLVHVQSSTVGSHISRIRRSLMRRLPNCAGFYRSGQAGAVLIVVGPRPTLHALTMRTPVGITIEGVSRPNRRRAWRSATRGMMVSRDEYGEQTNRYYHRGLPPREKERWAVATRAGIRSRHRTVAVGVRAVRDDVSLHPPEAWRLPRLLKRKGPERARFASPILIGSTVPNVLAAAFASAAASASPVNPRARASAPSFSAMTGFRAAPPAALQGAGQQLGQKATRIPAGGAPTSPNTQTLVPKGWGYRSSLPTEKADFTDWAARMAEKARARERGSG